MKKMFCLTILAFLFVFISGGCSNQPAKTQTYMEYVDKADIEEKSTQEFYNNIIITLDDECENNGSTQKLSITVSIPDLSECFANISKNGGTMTELPKQFPQYLKTVNIETEVRWHDGEWTLASTQEIEKLIADEVDEFLISVLETVDYTDIYLEYDMEMFGQ